MARRYVMTARRKAALRKAQMASARKRRKNYRAANRQARKTINKNLSTGQYGRNYAFGGPQRKAQREYEWAKHNNAVKHKGKKQRTRKQVHRRYVAKQTAIVGAYLAADYAMRNPGSVKRGVSYAKAPAAYARGFGRGVKQSRARQAAARRNMARVDFGRATSVRVSQQALPRGSSRSGSSRRVRGY